MGYVRRDLAKAGTSLILNVRNKKVDATALCLMTLYKLFEN